MQISCFLGVSNRNGAASGIVFDCVRGATFLLGAASRQGFVAEGYVPQQNNRPPHALIILCQKTEEVPTVIRITIQMTI